MTPDADQTKKMSYMDESIGQIEHLIKDLVDWAAIEKGKLRIEKANFELTVSLKKTAEIFKDGGFFGRPQIEFCLQV